MKITLNLESFTGFIEVYPDQFIPTKVTTVTNGKVREDGTSNNGTSKEKQLGFCRTMPAAINKIVLEVLGNSNDELTLSQFLLKYQSITNQLESLVNIEA